MGLTIVLQDEKGKPIAGAVEDVKNVLSRVLPNDGDESFRLLRYIDRYGDTVFNQRQLDDLLDDWSRLKDRTQSDEEREVVDAVELLLKRGLEDVHRYIRFIGD